MTKYLRQNACCSIFMSMMAHWWRSFRDIARYGDSQPTELMLGLFHSVLLPLLMEDYKHLPSWMVCIVFLMGLMQSYYAVVGHLIQRHVINIAVAFASVAFVFNTSWHGDVSETHCLILSSLVSLWNAYRTNFEVNHKVGSTWKK